VQGFIPVGGNLVIGLRADGQGGERRRPLLRAALHRAARHPVDALPGRPHGGGRGGSAR
jgi:hypothetical protein